MRQRWRKIAGRDGLRLGADAIDQPQHGLQARHGFHAVATGLSGTGIATPPALTSPNSSPLAGPTQFIWNAGTAGASMYALWIGTAQGTYNLYTSGHVASTVTSRAVPNSQQSDLILSRSKAAIFKRLDLGDVDQ